MVGRLLDLKFITLLKKPKTFLPYFFVLFCLLCLLLLHQVTNHKREIFKT